MKYLLFIVLLIFISLSIYITFYQKLDIFKIDSGNPGLKILFIGGVHGNEPSGKKALKKLIKNGINIDKGSISIIDTCNPSGGLLYLRWQLTFMNPDLNRNFPIVINGKCKDVSAKFIINEVHKADLIIDFHEGWGFHLKNKKSLGSTISPTSLSLSNNISTLLLQKINKTITNPIKKFVILKNRSCDIKGTLGCYCEIIRKPYVLIEISGQFFVQPLQLRIKQAIIFINTILTYLKN